MSSHRSSLPAHVRAAVGPAPSGVGGLGFRANTPLRQRGAGGGPLRPAMSRLNAPGTPSSSSESVSSSESSRSSSSVPGEPPIGDAAALLRGVVPRRQEIQRDVHLFTYTLAAPTRFHYQVECAKYQRLAITLCFDGSDNVVLDKHKQQPQQQQQQQQQQYQHQEDSGEVGPAAAAALHVAAATVAAAGLPEEGPLRCTVIAPPFQRVTVGTLRIRDARSKTHLKLGYKLKVLPPDERMYDAAVKRDADLAAEALQGARYAGLASHPTLRSLNEACDEYAVHFVDVDFPPGPAALGHVNPSSPASASFGLEGAGGAAELLDAISATSVPNDLARENDAAAADVKAFLSSFSGNRITWRRPFEFLGRNYDLFRLRDPASSSSSDDDGDDAVDIRPGRLGNFWLLGALACVAERPALIKRIFQVPGEGRNSGQRNAHGAYKLRLCKHGAWSDVLLDDYFPCSPGGGPVFSRSNGAELWVLLVEKAFAKLHGGYAFLRGARGGWAYQGLADLTGAPTEVVRFDVKFDARALWEDVLEHDHQGQLMCACTKGEDPWADWKTSSVSAAASAQTPPPTTTTADSAVAAAAEAMANKENLCAAAYARGDLIPGHAYAVLAVRETRFGDRLVRVRNPWGRVDWTGDWSPTSSKWTEEAIADVSGFAFGGLHVRDATAAGDGGGGGGRTLDAEAGAKGSTDAGGSFWMCWNDFLKRFASLAICRIHSNSSVTPTHSSRLLPHAALVETPAMRPEPWDEQRIRGYFLYNEARAAVVKESVGTVTPRKHHDNHEDTPGKEDHPVKTAMYIMDVPCDTETSVVLSLHQQDYAVAGAKPYVDFGLTVMSLAEDGQSFALVPGGSSGCQVAREVSVEVNLRAGRYVVVPTSSGAMFRHTAGFASTKDARPASEPAVGLAHTVPLTRRREVEASSMLDSLRARAEGQSGQPATEGNTSQHVFLPAAEIAFLEMFARLDEDMDGVLSRKELDHFMLMSEGAAMQPKVYEWILLTFECERVSVRSSGGGSDGGGGGDDSEESSLGLTARGFLALYMYIFESGGADEALLWRDLKFMGYDDHLDLVGARNFVLSTHAPAGCALVLQKVPYDREAYAAALEVPVTSDADAREALDEDNDVILYRRSAGNWGVSFAVENAAGTRKDGEDYDEDEEDEEQTLVFTLDCAASRNVVSHAGALRHTVRVPPGGETRVVHYLVPNVQGAWQWQYEASWEWEDTVVEEGGAGEDEDDEDEDDEEAV